MKSSSGLNGTKGADNKSVPHGFLHLSEYVHRDEQDEVNVQSVDFLSTTAAAQTSSIHRVRPHLLRM
ncbi:hypothetical protein AS189_03690 [Arthrobacter alpinus]|uniref:Uncharacterized protein n=1 Tax=Arthrobacter alpinus TaxID=656366 RepID=A0A0S2LWH8_9MICC|nr:hypothetical protein AS189_03690 [Arthrobacter alpinus]